MRLFWAFIGVVVLGAAGALGWSWTAGHRAASRLAEAQVEEARAGEQRAIEETRRVEAEGAVEAQAAQLAEAMREIEALRERERVQREAPRINTPAVVESAPVVIEVKPSAPAPAPEAPKPAPAVATAKAAAPAGALVPIGGYETAAGVVEARDDGATLLDDTHVVKGSGTVDDPYRITWELLTSGEQDFDPRAGKKKIPGRLAFLNGRHVRISGYVAFPVMMKEPRELLAMLNQWDGCCIGVPPTPYDAVEVQLAKPVTGNNRFAAAGSVTGVFHVKPYVVGDWLVGLYLMEQAQLDATDFSGAGE